MYAMLKRSLMLLFVLVVAAQSPSAYAAGDCANSLGCGEGPLYEDPLNPEVQCLIVACYEGREADATHFECIQQVINQRKICLLFHSVAYCNNQANQQANACDDTWEAACYQAQTGLWSCYLTS